MATHLTSFQTRRKDELLDCMTHGASILLDLGTYGPKFTKHRRHQCVYYLFYRGVVYFWELLEIESNETPEDTDEQTAAQAKTWGNQVLEKLEAIVQELLIHGVLPVAIVADNGSVPQYAIKRVLDKWPFIYQVRCGVHTLMLVVKRLCEVEPFCQLEEFVSRLRQASEMEHCPRISEVKWNSAFYALEYAFKNVPEEKMRLLTSEDKIDRMRLVLDSLRVFAEETNVLQTDKANALTLMRSMTRVLKRIKEDELFESVREALIEDMKMRWDQNFCGEHMCLTASNAQALNLRKKSFIPSVAQNFEFSRKIIELPFCFPF